MKFMESSRQVYIDIKLVRGCTEGVHALLQLALAQWEQGRAGEAAPLLLRGLSIIQDHQRRTRGGRSVEASSRPITVSHL